MANPWFRFKQFTVHHDQCAMKVTTDACLFGAWVASKMAGNPATRNVLDIGTGTGLLSLMLAQQLPGTHFDAVELDAGAAAQAKANVEQSPFATQIQVIPQDVLLFEATHHYDLIISNPPFHERQLPSPHGEKNKAHHDATLTLNDLARACSKMLSPNGQVALLLPYYRKDEALKLLQEHGLHPAIVCDVKQSTSHSFFRTMILSGTAHVAQVKQEIIVIKNEDQEYTPEFVTLLKDYYLIF
jgi:tRNA1Val (adenine37-N6)-methyltransferase